jgi:hypothetical protein
MGFFGKLLSAPVRILDTPAQVINAMTGSDDIPTLEDAAKAVEKQVDRIVGDEE